MLKRLTTKEYIDGILAANRMILSRAITLTESNLPADKILAREVLNAVLTKTGNSIRIGITGVPGVGKSTFIEAFGQFLTKQGKKVAVLAIDPSSQISKGSILGDKTRMEKLVNEPLAYIRPSPTSGGLGGVANKTREAMLLCEAAGFEVIIIETVGVGQSETLVHGMVDFFLLLMLAGAGDELQGIKKGIMEMADLIAITKTDSGNELQAGLAKVAYQSALHLFPPNQTGWYPEVLTCSALTEKGISEIWQSIEKHRLLFTEKGFFQQKRSEQNLAWMYDFIKQSLEEKFYQHPNVSHHLKDIQQEVSEGKKLPINAAIEMLNLFYQT
ncbi:methylmalonyl Co-A mutase-associated GTPase MeaB [Arcicella lustrica]|uniref:Methylmalonyl Co-A mutase-associated GTPase MeaB n=1 Tax=Arcicella lustrica TaxID=2984196 RepID=A0ABU5SNJ4_9BACT|nr:methylmalonyl Co-A mutase-associated GTPase MeaB [Arcicella sp. DC25W]MEA5428876.1 methylmalonyl Co-A mutase-associated GTPase MeaB [Arcicella sp. DC25W]